MVRRMGRPVSEASPVRRLAALGVGLVVIGALVGAVTFYGNPVEDGSSEQDASAALRAVREAYAATTGSESVKVRVEQRATGSSRGQAVSEPLKTGRAVLDYANSASSVTVHSPGQGAVKTLTIDQIVYQKVPKDKRKQIPGHKPWIRVDQRKVDKAQFGPGAAKVQDQPPADPASILVYLRGVTSAKAAGAQEANGSRIRRYTATVDLMKAVRGTDPKTRVRAEQLEQQLGKDTLSMRVRLDQQNRVRRLEATLPTSSGGPQAASQARSLTLSEDFYAYNAGGRVHAPAPSKTADITKQVLLQQQQQRRQQRIPRP